MLKISVCFTLLLIGTDVVLYRPDYIFNVDVDGWVNLHLIPATWKEAFLRCHHEGAVLTSPLNKDIVTTLHKIMSESNVNGPIHLGTHDLFSEGDFFSVEGVPLADMFIKWRKNSTITDTGDCLSFTINGEDHYMSMSSCTMRLPYICFKKRDSSTKLNGCGTFDNNYHLDLRTSSCYKVHHDYQTWTRAHMICAAEGGYLVILNNEEEANIMKDTFPMSNNPNQWEQLHVGLRVWKTDNTWLTIHGEPIENVFHVWVPGQPDNAGGSQFCGRLIQNGTLDDIQCSRRSRYVCEKDPNFTRYEPVEINVF